MFEMLDTDGGGSIDEEEFVQGLAKEIGASQEGKSGASDRMKFIEALYKGLQIGYSAPAEGEVAGSVRSRARAIFKHIDEDGGGSIEFGEMLAALYYPPEAHSAQLAAHLPSVPKSPH